MGVGAWLADMSISKTADDLGFQQFLEFTQNGVKEKKNPQIVKTWQICAKRRQRKMAKLMWANKTDIVDNSHIQSLLPWWAEKNLSMDKTLNLVADVLQQQKNTPVGQDHESEAILGTGSLKLGSWKMGGLVFF